MPLEDFSKEKLIEIIKQKDKQLEESQKYNLEKIKSLKTALKEERAKNRYNCDLICLEKNVIGAVKNCIMSHGPITKEFISSASKRILSSILSDVKDA
jgi:hypothetical protein